jgi:hypothetical protein
MDKIFTHTSGELYDRHSYKITLKNRKSVIFNNWEDVKEFWFNYNQVPDYLEFIEVIDKTKQKDKKIGFGK